MARKNTLLRELKDKRSELISLKESYVSYKEKREASKALKNHGIQAGSEEQQNSLNKI